MATPTRKTLNWQKSGNSDFMHNKVKLALPFIGRKERNKMTYYIKNRVKKAQEKAFVSEEWGGIIQLIANGAYYDELTPEQQEAYKRYKESAGGVARDISLAELHVLFDEKTKEEAFHFKLSKREKPPTPEEHRKNVEEVQAFFLEMKEEYNSPEATAERERRYQERNSKYEKNNN